MASARELGAFALRVARERGHEVRQWWRYRDVVLGEVDSGWVFAAAVGDDGEPFAFAEDGELRLWPSLEAAQLEVDRLWRLH